MISIGFSLILIGLLSIEFLMIFMILFYSSNIELHVFMMIYKYPCIIWFSSHVYEFSRWYSRFSSIWIYEPCFHDYHVILMVSTKSRSDLHVKIKVGTQAYFPWISSQGYWTTNFMILIIELFLLSYIELYDYKLLLQKYSSGILT